MWLNYTSPDEIFKYFTCAANIFVGQAALLYVIFQALVMSRILKQIPFPIVVIKLVATACITITGFIIILIIVPIVALKAVPTEYTVQELLFNGPFMLYHIFIPVFSIVTFMIFETDQRLKIYHNLYSMIPVLLYIFFYFFMSITHLDFLSGLPFVSFDWYLLFNICISYIPLICFGCLALIFGLSFLLYLGNNKIEVLKHHE